ncbi:MAG: hypothetical protein MK158_05715 [Dehalococcoidia bacterium]|nr:hypothetical protein [Dehalococcoidia bacterium]
MVITERDHPYYDEYQGGSDSKTDPALFAFGNDFGIFLRGGFFSVSSLLGSPAAAAASARVCSAEPSEPGKWHCLPRRALGGDGEGIGGVAWRLRRRVFQVRAA